MLAPAAAQLLELAGRGQPRPAIDFVLDLLVSGAVIDEIITDVLAQVQLEVGARWEANQWGVADEHAATAVIDGVLGALAFHVPVPQLLRGSVLVACAEGEHHTLPARMGAELLRRDGWDVTFLGGSLPSADLQRYAGVTEPDVVVVSCTVPLFLAGARRCFAAVAALGVPALAAGRAFGPDATRAERLGASAWIGPGDTLDAALGRVRTPPADAWPTPPEAAALELASEDLQQSCLAAMFERLPQMSGYSQAQLASTRTDVGYILGYLQASIDLGDDTIFGEFAGWSAHVLAVRGVPAAVFEQSLAIIGDVVASAGMPEAARLCEAHAGDGSPD